MTKFRFRGALCWGAPFLWLPRTALVKLPQSVLTLLKLQQIKFTKGIHHPSGNPTKGWAKYGMVSPSERRGQANPSGKILRISGG